MKNSRLFEKLKKIVISLFLIIIVSFTIPIKSQAGAGKWVSNKIGKPLMQLVCMVGDIGVGVLHLFVLGIDFDEGLMDSVMLDPKNLTVTEGDLRGDPSEVDLTYNADQFDDELIGIDNGDELSIPNIMVNPEYIFSDRIALLDIDFINPTKYDGRQLQTLDDDGRPIEGGTVTEGLRTTISSWYRAFRNIAIVGLLTILVYIGIRVLIGSTAQDKAKYKERFKDWLVGLCLVFFIHYIMVGILLITKGITQLLANVNSDYVIGINGVGEGGFLCIKENLTGYVRLMAEGKDLANCFAYVTMYICLVIYTYMFLFKYIKRVLYMAFFTMIAPLVAMTYPLDKLADGKAQGFSMWFREYFMNALIQPIHLIIYTVFVSSASELASHNVLYALVVMGFLLPAEKMIKKMFRLDRGETTGALSDIAGGALAIQGLKTLASAGNSNTKQSSSKSEQDSSKIRVSDDSRGKMDIWKDGNANNGNANNMDDGMTRPRTVEAPQTETAQHEPTPMPVPQPSAHSFAGAGAGGNEQRPVNEASEIPDPGAQGGTPIGEPAGEPVGEPAGEPEGTPVGEPAGGPIPQPSMDTPNPGAEEDGAGEPVPPINPENDNDEQQNAGEPNRGENGEPVPGNNRPAPQRAPTASERFRSQLRDKMPTFARAYDKVNSKVSDSTKQKIKGVGKLGVRGSKFVAKGLWKNKGKILRTAAKVAGAGVGATIGLAAGVSTGDFSKIVAYSTAGTMAGRAIGNSTANVAGGIWDTAKKVPDAAREIRYAYSEETIGRKATQELRKQEAIERARKQYLKNSEEKAKYKEIADTLGIETKDAMNRAFDYKLAGITDDEKIEKGLEIEEKHKNDSWVTHDRMVAVMKEASRTSAETIRDDKKLKGLEKSVESKVGSHEQAERIVQLVAEAHGEGENYKQVLEGRRAEERAAKEQEAARAQAEADAKAQAEAQAEAEAKAQAGAEKAKKQAEIDQQRKEYQAKVEENKKKTAQQKENMKKSGKGPAFMNMDAFNVNPYSSNTDNPNDGDNK